MLSWILINERPIKKSTNAHLLADTFPPLNRKYPITKFNNAHSTFTSGEDKPSPGGVAKGVGKPLPETPFT